MNMLETNEKIETFTKKKKISGKIKQKIQNKQYGNKKLSDELNNRVEETKERIRKLDNREIEMTQSERQRENGLRKNLEPQGALGL